MTAESPTFDSARGRSADAALAWLRRNGWTLGLIVFFFLLLGFTRIIQPSYGVTGVQGLAISVLPLALAAVAQAVVVIAGGIDLSIGSMMALTSVVSASLMMGASQEFAVVVVIGVLLLGLVLGAVNGGLVVLTRVPDIVVTLAMAFVWAGCALLVLPTPGGGSAQWLRDLVLGSLGNEWIPKAAVVLIVIVAVIWIPIRRSRLGLSLYAVGSHQLAAFRSGVPIGRTKLVAYMLGGLFSALAGLSLTASTGIGTPVPGPYTLLSVAAIVLGGVSLAGGRGGIVGPIVAVMVLSLIRTDMTFLRLNTNLADGRPGRDPHRRGHVRHADPDPSRTRMSSAVDTADARNTWLTAAAWRRLFRDRPMIPLLVLLGVLVVISELVRPGVVSTQWVGTILRGAVPLAILAGCQTMAMLTGGIDLSVGAVASMTGFVLATLVGGPGLAAGLAIALLIAALAGLVTGIGVGVFRVHPLIMTLGMSLVVLGLANVWQIVMVQTGGGVPGSLRTLGTGTLLGVIPYSFVVFVPVAAIILLGLRRSGYGRLLYAVGDNPIAARLFGRPCVAGPDRPLRDLGRPGGDRRLPHLGPHERGQRHPRGQLRPALGRGGGHRRDVDHGRARRLRRHDPRRPDPDGPQRPPELARLPRGGPPSAVRRDHRGGGGGLYQGDRRDLMAGTAQGAASRHLGLDLGGTNIKVVVLEHDADGWRVLHRDQVATPAADGPDRVVARLAEVGAEAIGRCPGVSSVGIGIPGLYDPAAGTTRFLVNIPGAWAGHPVAGPVGEALGCPTALINDARAFGLAELRLGAARGASSMIGLTLGTGVGGVIAVDGHVHQGHDGTGGELGHQTLDPDGPTCGCGNRGCLEAYARADRIAEACGTASVEEAIAKPIRRRAGARRL